MKVIDLLNMIANDEIVPKTIMYYDTVYEYDGENNFYYDVNGCSLYREFFVNGNCLDDEVEIMEEDKKIDKLCYQQLRGRDVVELITTLNEQLSNHGEKINELVDKVNKLQSKG